MFLALPMSVPTEFRIGQHRIAPATVLAPMAGVTDTVFRRLIRNQSGCGLIMTEFTSADVKAISFANSAPDTTAYNSPTHDPAGNHWRVLWDSGVTEPGSSGSCLFDATSKRCIGQLHGGPSVCGAGCRRQGTHCQWLKAKHVRAKWQPIVPAKPPRSAPGLVRRALNRCFPP